MIYLDLDDTLFATEHLKPYLRTNEGRKYIANNIHRFDVEFCQGMEEIVDEFSEQITILTDSPEEYARAILQKHGLKFPIIANAGKPFVNLQPEKDSIIIGDSAKDVLAAHKLKIPSIAVTWGYSTQKQLEEAEATEIATTPEKIYEILALWQTGDIEHRPREKPKEHTRLPEKEWTTPPPTIEVITLSEYKKWVRGEHHEHSANILDYKRMKDQTPQQLMTGREKYFNAGRIRLGNKFIDTYLAFRRTLQEKLKQQEHATIIAAPNSLPQFCYKTDINRVMTRDIARTHQTPKFRTVYRVRAKQEAHYGNRDTERQLKTLGVKNYDITTNHVIIFDDIITSGQQIEAIARMIRYMGYQGKFTALALGKA